eukprot:scaffold597_cov176-Amphora_coffeaeformis.AAC.29
MKFSAAVVGLVASLATKFSNAEISEAHLRVKCKGVDHKGLTNAEQKYAGMILMTTYNMVHMIVDDGDFVLFEIEPDEYFVAADADADADTKVDNLHRYSYNDGSSFHGGGRCDLCPDDDGGDDDPFRPSGNPICWYFPFVCRKMVGEQGNMLEGKKETRGKHDTGKAHKIWEEKFAEQVSEGPFAAFADAKKCNIELITTPLDPAIVTNGEGLNNNKVFLRASAMD